MSFPQWGKPQARTAQTTIKCHVCQHPLIVHRACQQVVLHCASCDRDFPLREYIQDMDDILEDFMENVYCNRI
ncbi:MAG: dual CXXC motif small (seleno)protein [Desulfovibrionaceae bacterium]